MRVFESSVDFFCFCLKKHRRLSVYLPLIVYGFTLYKLNLLSEEKIYKYVGILTNVILNNKDDIEVLLREFWDKNECKLKSQFLSMLKIDDVIVTGAPGFLIDGIRNKFGTENIFSSIYNLETGELELLCYGENKVKIFRESYPNEEIDEFYTDSMRDKPMMKISKRVYLVQK